LRAELTLAALRFSVPLESHARRAFVTSRAWILDCIIVLQGRATTRFEFSEGRKPERVAMAELVNLVSSDDDDACAAQDDTCRPAAEIRLHAAAASASCHYLVVAADSVCRWLGLPGLHFLESCILPGM
jgi:hypothetical protein